MREANAAEAERQRDAAAAATTLAERNAEEAAAAREKVTSLERDVSTLEDRVEEHAASRASAHAAHGTTKMRLAMMKNAGSIDKEGAHDLEEGQQRQQPEHAHAHAPPRPPPNPNTLTPKPFVDWGAEGPKPWLTEPQIMGSTPEDIVAYQVKLLDEYNDASVALKMNQPQASDQGFDPSQTGHLRPRG